MTVRAAISQPVVSFFDPGQRVYWLYLLTTAAIALGVFVLREGRQRRLTEFFQFVFPGKVWRHQSTRTDIVFFVVNRVVFSLLLAPFALVAYPYINDLVFSLLLNFGTPGAAYAPTYVIVIYGICALAAFDLAIYLAHFAQHKWSFLWQFHKVHHSAEVLNPLTAYRMHPVDDLLTLSLAAVTASIVHSVFSFHWANSFSSVQLAVTGIGVMVFYLLGYHLRHSHIWLSYGPLLSRLLISPAQHQIHHSRERRHRDKNLGYMFAIWDGIFGTLYVPKTPEKFELGLSDEPSQTYHSAVACYFKPFGDVYKRWKRPLAGLSIVLIAASAVSVGAETGQRQSRTLLLEALTSDEVESMISAGYRRVIVPTGGIEQNGSHAALGKHNFVVSYAAERIARELGGTLVAPVVRYVPQGSILPPEKHMRFAGTISLRESTFESILEDISRSLIAHGFTHVYFVGDSAGNQSAQQRVAEKLSQEFMDRQLTVMHVGEYYADNGQFAHLQEQGFSDEQIGWHAGIRDTSELLYVAPDAVRSAMLRLSERQDGVSGAYWRADEKIGKTMIDLKVVAAVRQIRARD